MRAADVLRLAVTALYQQKTRTALTTLGVAVGSFVLLLSLSVGLGIQDAVAHEFRRHDALRNIETRAGYGKVEERIPAAELEVKGDVSEAKRLRLRERLKQRWINKNGYPPTTPLTPELVEAMRRWPHVAAVTPMYNGFGRASFGDKGEDVQTVSAPASERRLRGRLVAGDWFAADDDESAVVSEYLLYLWGLSSNDAVQGALGRKVRLEYHTGQRKAMTLLSMLNVDPAGVGPEEERVLQKVAGKLPTLLPSMDLTPGEMATLTRTLRGPAPAKPSEADRIVTQELTIVGVVRGPEKDDPPSESLIDRFRPDADVIVPVGAAEKVFLQFPHHQEDGLQFAQVTVDDEDHVQEVVDRIEAAGLSQYSLAEFAQRVRTNLALLMGAMSVLALVALLVSALGITNTLVMSVMERTHEIGVMKAVGARDRHVVYLFLVEGALIGLLGGGLGLLAAWLVSFPGDAWMRGVMLRQGDIHVTQSIFVFPWWLTLGVPLFGTLITTLAALYPARRAAGVRPVEALRHE